MKEYSHAKPGEYCYVPDNQNDKFHSIAKLFISNGYNNIIFSNYESIEKILLTKEFKNSQLVSRKRNFTNIDYINLARIYENNWNYIIVRESVGIKYEVNNSIPDDDILMLLKLNNMKRTLSLVMANHNDNSLTAFDKAIFNLYSTIGISIKSNCKFGLKFSITNSLFQSLSERYAIESNFLPICDYAYYDKYSINTDVKPKIICCERYNKEYWIEYINQIRSVLIEFIKPLVTTSYIFIEFTNTNPYYYHQILSISNAYVVYCWNNTEESIESKFEQLYPYLHFVWLNDEYTAYVYAVHANILLADSIFLLAAAIINQNAIYVYNTCPDIIKLNHWINYDRMGEFTVCCVGLDTKFIKHYINIGFTKIIFWNNSKNTVESNKFLITIPVTEQISNMRKFQMYNKTIRNYCKCNDKLLVIDDDEFLDVSVGHIESFTDSISFRWKIYGAGNEIFHTDDYSKFNMVEISQEFKTMVTVNESVVFNSNHIPNNHTANISKYYINHYITKSLEDYLLKCKLRINVLGSLRYEKQAYQNFIRINPQFSIKITPEQFNTILHSKDIHKTLLNHFS